MADDWRDSAPYGLGLPTEGSEEWQRLFDKRYQELREKGYPPEEAHHLARKGLTPTGWED